MKGLAALACGLLFGLGLVISDMANPARVLAFLDVAGAWDPSLILVMGAALVPSTLAYRLYLHRQRPLLEAQGQLPVSGRPDAPLVVGAVLFGIGWGLVGLCPGPAVAALVTGRWPFVLFALAMLGGMGLHRVLHARR